MSLTNFPHGITSMGVPILGAQGIMTGGQAFFVDAANGSDDNTGTDISQPLKSVRTAYGKTTSGKNDVVYMLPSATADTWTTKLDWSNTYTHLIGLHPGWMNNRCRIATTTISKSMTPLLKVSGQGCIIANVMISQEGEHTSYNAVPLEVTGHRTYFENVHTRNIGAAAYGDISHRSLVIGSCYDVSFKHCQFGETSYDAHGIACAVIEFNGSNAGKYLFEDCMILGAGSTLEVFLKIPAFCGGFWLFKDCIFLNSVVGNLDAMTQAFSIANGGNDFVVLKHCIVLGASAFETVDSGCLYGIHAQAAATGELGVLLTY